MRSEIAKDLLAETDRVRSKVRAGRRGAWFALCVFGALFLASAPMYVQTKVAGLYGGPSSWEAIGSQWVSQYRLFAVPLGYLVCVGYYHRRAERTGVSGTQWPWVLTGLALLGLRLLATHAMLVGWIPYLPMGWAPGSVIALSGGFLVLAWLERNPYLAALSFVLFVLPAACQRIYDSLIGWHGFSGMGLATLVAGLALLSAGAFERTMEGRES